MKESRRYSNVHVKMTNKQLMNAYMRGFNDELSGKKFPNRLVQRDYSKAYIMGKIDASAGDDVSSVDLQTEEEILKRIKS
jgi:hypothetical protein